MTNSVSEDVAAVLARVFADSEESAIPKRLRKRVVKARASNPTLQAEVEVHLEKVKPKSARGENLRGTSSVRYSPRKYDKKQILEMFDSGLRAVDIARQLDAPHSSIRYVLLNSGRQINGKGGAKPKEFCDNGHEMAKHSRQIIKNGVLNGRYCVPCKANSGRRQRSQKEINGVQEEA